MAIFKILLLLVGPIMLLHFCRPLIGFSLMVDENFSGSFPLMVEFVSWFCLFFSQIFIYGLLVLPRFLFDDLKNVCVCI